MGVISEFYKKIGIKNIICKDCKEKEVKDEFINVLLD
jgi:hypothetical protein